MLVGSHTSKKMQQTKKRGIPSNVVRNTPFAVHINLTVFCSVFCVNIKMYVKFLFVFFPNRNFRMYCISLSGLSENTFAIYDCFKSQFTFFLIDYITP